MNSEKTNILFITLSNIGDVLLTTPVLQFLHRYDETASIDIVNDKRSSALLRHCPYRGEIFHKRKDQFLRGLPALLFELRRKRYDLIVDLRTDILAHLIRAGKRLTKTTAGRHVHAVEKHFCAVSAIAGDAKIPPTTLWLGQADKEYANTICRRLPGRKWLCIGPGANWDKKIWPAENYTLLAQALSGEFDTVVLLGNEADKQQAQRIARCGRLPCINLCGRTALLQAAALLQRMTLFIGNDSGLGHMASAVNTPSFTLFGPGNPERYRPWGELAAWHAAPDQNIESILVDTVAEKVHEHLTRISQNDSKGLTGHKKEPVIASARHQYRQ